MKIVSICYLFQKKYFSIWHINYIFMINISTELYNSKNLYLLTPFTQDFTYHHDDQVSSPCFCLLWKLVEIGGVCVCVHVEKLKCDRFLFPHHSLSQSLVKYTWSWWRCQFMKWNENDQLPRWIINVSRLGKLKLVS